MTSTATQATPPRSDASWTTRLAELGADAALLDADQRRSLDQQGFVIIHGLGDAAWLETARTRYEELVRIEAADLITSGHPGSEMHREAGCRRLPDLVNKGAVFDRAWLHPTLLAVVAHVLQRPFHLSALSGRDAVKGFGHQGLHADWGTRTVEEPFHVVNCIWALDGFSPENGGPRVIPGSHLLGARLADEVADPALPHPRQLIPRLPPGAVLAMNSHTWHGGTTNRDGTPRRTLHAYYSARDHAQQLDQREYLRVRTAERLSAAARWLLNA